MFYGLAFAGIPTILLTLLYCFRPKKWLGGIALFCNIFMLICAGGVLTTTGNRISECMHGSSSVSTCMFHGGGGHSNASFSATAALVDASASLVSARAVLVWFGFFSVFSRFLFFSFFDFPANTCNHPRLLATIV